MDSKDINKLRSRAEDLQKLDASGKSLTNLESDALQLIQELEVYQIELELSNEELLLARDEAETLTSKYTALYDFAPMGYLSIDKEELITELNFSAAKMLGKDRSYFIEKDFKTCIDNNDIQVFSDFITKIFVSKSKQTCELKLKFSNTNSHTFCHLEGIVNADDHCMLAMMDITKIKKNEKELKEARTRAEDSEQTKSGFLSNMSHEIRAPLNAVIGFSKLLVDAEAKDKKTYLDQINTNSMQLLVLINDILNISKIESGNFELKNDLIDLPLFIQSLYDKHLNKIANDPRKHKLNLTLSVPEEEVAGVIIDSVRLIQVFDNLLSNATKFTDEGTIEVGYSYESNALQFYVKDEGIGIAENQLKKIFDRFSQALDISKDFGGTGLGLTICQGIINKMGGKIWVESSINLGSTFFFMIPKVVGDMKLLKVTDENRKTKKKKRDRSGKKVLIVDDSPTVLFYYKSLFKKHGIDFFLAASGKQAIQTYKENKVDIDLVLMDIMMPIMDGVETLMRLKEINPNIRVIAQTALAMKSEIDKFLSAGFEDYLTKPIDEALLLRLISE
ncbi:MAG: signal transduction histidine kinase/CheY-like chemotaxis protein [Roseivirga sp.]|jgi:signal transduction histidine kinase/CheY-like chemotaxis protein